MLNFTLSLDAETRPLDRYWEFCVGSCHAATALRADYREMLTRCHRELGFRYLRFHGLFDDDMSVVRRPVFADRPQFSFSNIDSIYDFLLSIGMKPFVELSFMPSALASGTSTIFHYKGNTSPPADYAAWGAFIRTFVEHLLERYGRGEVRQWFFEVWNEPNLGGPGSPYGFWSADRDEYFKLYKTTAEAVKACDSRLRVGGPATSNNAWIPEFLDFCKASGAPVDFVTTHHYPTDVVLGYGVEDSANFANPLPLDDADRVRDVLALAKEGGKAFEDFKAQYSVFQSQIWAHVPRGVLTDMTRRAVSETRGLPLYYTEWGSLAGLKSDGPFGASFIAKTVLDGVDLVKGYSFWTFCDIVEENGQDAREFHGGFGLLTQHGVPKAPYRVYELLHRLDGALYEQVGRGETVDVYAVKNEAASAVQLLAVNHNSLLHDIEAQTVRVCLRTEKPCAAAEICRVDDTHANALRAWQQMGEPAYLQAGELDALRAASALRREAQAFADTSDGVTLDFDLPPMGTALVTVYF